MIAKKLLIYISLPGTIIFFAFGFSKEIGLCAAYSYSYCLDILNQSAEALIPILAVLLFSLITYWMREEVYQAWFRFARWWIPLSMLLILISPEYSSDWLYPVVKGTVAFLTSIIFAAVSSLIILVKYLRRSR